MAEGQLIRTYEHFESDRTSPRVPRAVRFEGDAELCSEIRLRQPECLATLAKR